MRDHDELFTEPAWLQVMEGQGLVPRASHPLAGVMDDAELDTFVGHIGQVIARCVDQMPDHVAFIARTCQAAVAAPNP